MSLHVVFALLIIEFTLLFGSGILVLLVLRHEIVHVALGFRKLHLVHALGRDVAHARLNVVRNPFHEVGRIFVLHVEHLLVDFLGRHAATKQRSSCQIPAVARVRGAHHVLSIEHLLRQLRNGESTVLLGTTRCERCEACHEEVESWEGNQIDCNLAQVAIQLPWEAQACRHTAHGRAHQVIQVAVSWCSELQCAEANIVECLVVEQEAFVGVFDKLVKRQHALYGSTTVSDTLGDGITENVSMMRSGYSSRTLEINRVPMPEPVPPPNE